jgi:hypothetical protein
MISSTPSPAGHPEIAVSVFAASIASRNEQSPSEFNSSAVVVTLMVIPALARSEGVNPNATRAIIMLTRSLYRTPFHRLL